MAVTADIFKLLKDGSIISTNTKDESIKNILYHLSDEINFEKNQEIFTQLGYKLIREYDCFYLTKEDNLEDKEIEKFLKKYRDVFFALAILKHFFPAISSGSELNKSELIAKSHSNENIQIKEILEILTKKEDNLSGSIEVVLKILRNYKIIEQNTLKNEEKHTVLNSIDYFNGIINQLEINNA